MENFYKAIGNNDFEAACEEIQELDYHNLTNLVVLAKLAGIEDGKTAHRLVLTIQASYKKEMMKELDKQIANLRYWVDRN